VANYTPQGIDFAKCIPAEIGTYPSALRQMLPLVCMQCANPSCKDVCPTGATQQDENGIVTVDPKLCMGCKYCVMACPYGARHIIPEFKTYFPDAEGDLDPYEQYARNKWEAKAGYGIAAKCDYCQERTDKGLKPACVAACPAKARYFGDIDDSESEVSILIRREHGFVLNPEFGNDPSCFYLPPR